MFRNRTSQFEDYPQLLQMITGIIQRNKRYPHVQLLADELNNSPIAHGISLPEPLLDIIEDSSRLMEIEAQNSREPIRDLANKCCGLVVNIYAFQLLNDNELNELMRNREIYDLYTYCEDAVADLELYRNQLPRDCVPHLQQTDRGSVRGRATVGSARVDPVGGFSSYGSKNVNPFQDTGGRRNSFNGFRSEPLSNKPAERLDEIEPQVKSDKPRSINFNWSTDNYYQWNGYNGLPLARPVVPMETVEVILDPKTNTLTVGLAMDRNQHVTDTNRRANIDFNIGLDTNKEKSDDGNNNVVIRDADSVNIRDERVAQSLDEIIYSDDTPKGSVTPYSIDTRETIFNEAAETKAFVEILKSEPKASEIYQYVTKHSNKGFFRYMLDNLKENITISLLSNGIRQTVVNVHEFIAGYKAETNGEIDTLNKLQAIYRDEILSIVDRASRINKEGSITLSKSTYALRYGRSCSDVNLVPGAPNYVTISELDTFDFIAEADDGLASYVVNEPGRTTYLVLDDAVFIVQVNDNKMVLIPNHMVSAMLMGNGSNYSLIKPNASQLKDSQSEQKSATKDDSDQPVYRKKRTTQDLLKLIP